MNLAKALFKEGSRQIRHWLPAQTKPAILMYHRIGSSTFDPWGLCVSEERFARQLGWLAGNRAVMPLGELAERHRSGRLPRDAVALTFDDGYASVMAAVPLLERLGMHATVFLPTEIIKHRLDFWWDELARIVLHASAPSLPFEENHVSVPPADPTDASWAPHAPPRTPRQKLFHSLWRKLRTRPPGEIETAIAKLRGQSPAPAADDDRPLTPREVRATASNALEFGSHALNHPRLPALSAEEKECQIKQSLEECASLTGQAPTAFAYPYGDLDTPSMRLVEEAGFVCACATGNAFVTERSDRFALPRQYVGDWEAARLGDMLGGS